MLQMSLVYQPKGGLLITDEALSECYRHMHGDGAKSAIENARSHLAFANPLLGIVLDKTAEVLAGSYAADEQTEVARVVDSSFAVGAYVGYFGLLVTTKYELPTVDEDSIEQGFYHMSHPGLPPDRRDRIWEALIEDYDHNLRGLVDTVADTLPSAPAVRTFMRSGAGCVSFFVDLQVASDILRTNATNS